MLEVKNLVKVYSTKGGVKVRALDGVSVQFPETGMVFLLGRSGSGKSTLLNVAGGLDKPDSGEVIVKGKSSKTFSSADFDSYRNTFIGFIFQEYNILNEFTVEQNIALALQLQNKPVNKKIVDELLEQVDLKGFGKRKPNTLSGGQKQRIAIARALIKQPEIIMADEPTGALDSNTGKQVFDTLKKLSKEKLVIVVSHDRDFAEEYGDRIIELKDGQILSDVQKSYAEPTKINENIEVVSNDTISIKDASKLTEADIKGVLAVLKKTGGEAIITAGDKTLPDVKRACRITDDGSREYFKDTSKVDIVEYDGKKTKFIKSKLPKRHAFKMGASGLKTKPFRLLSTILLSVVAFLMFGVVSTFSMYDPNYSISEALKESDYPSITVAKYYNTLYQSIKIDNKTGETTVEYESEELYTTRFGVGELAEKNANGKGKYAGIFDLTNRQSEYNSYGGFMGGSSSNAGSIALVEADNSTTNVSIDSKLQSYYPITSIAGFTDCGKEYMESNGFTLVDGKGKYPETPTEIAIPEYMANLFVNTKDSGITKASDMVGKTIQITGINALTPNNKFTVVGVYNVGTIPTKYDGLKDTSSQSISKEELESLTNSYNDYLDKSFNTIFYVSADFYGIYEKYIQKESYMQTVSSKYVDGVRIEYSPINEDVGEMGGGVSIYTQSLVNANKKSFQMANMSEQEITELNLKENEVLVSVDTYMMMFNNYYSDLSNRLQLDNFINNLKRYPSESINAQDISDFITMKDAGNMQGILPFISANYAKITYREYILDAYMAMTIANGYNTNVELYNRANEYRSNIDGNQTPTVTPLTDAEWTTLAGDVENNFKTLCEQKYYYYYMNDIRKASYKDEKVRNNVESQLGNSVDFICDNLANNATVNFEQVKSFIDSNYAQIVGREMKTGESMFEPNIDQNGMKLYYKDYKGESGELTIVGVFAMGDGSSSQYIVSDEFVAKHRNADRYGENDYDWQSVLKTDYVEPEDARYNYIITLTDNSQEQIADALEAKDGVTLKITNQVVSQLDMFLGIITEMETVFLIMGCVLGVFAALMLLNFISISINAKKNEIGILRAVGARGSDVFKIFFAEAFIIASICFVLAAVGAYFVCGILNSEVASLGELGISLTLLDYSIVNVALILVVAFGISIIATFFPVYVASRKSPVESIRAL